MTKAVGQIVSQNFTSSSPVTKKRAEEMKADLILVNKHQIFFVHNLKWIVHNCVIGLLGPILSAVLGL